MEKRSGPARYFQWRKSSSMSLTNGKIDYSRQEDERIAIKQFRKAVQDVLLPQHDDQFVLRWLKARDFDISKAERMLRESLKFRRKMAADSILTSDYQFPEVYEKHPVTQVLGFDSEHSVVRLFMAGICDYKGYVYSLRVIDLMKILLYVLEHDLKLLQEKKKKIGKIDEKMTFILDFQGFNLKQFYDKSVINAGIQLITMYQDNYPETLKAAYLVNVPSYFSWIFNLFKPFLNAVTLSKIKIFRSDEWRKDVFKLLDPKYLPGYLGGTRTDPDGDPMCRSLICWDSKIPTSYYLKQNQSAVLTDDPSMKTATVNQRSNFEVNMDVEIPGSVIKWIFQTKEYNIRFGLFYKRSKTHCEVLIPVESVDCQVIPEQGELLCDKKGSYVLHFDNSYSWLTAKQLLYKVEIEKPSETNNN